MVLFFSSFFSVSFFQFLFFSILFDFLKTARILQLATFPSPFLFVFNQFSNTHFCFIVSLNITIIILILKNNIPLPFCCCRCWISQSQSYYKSNAHSHTIMWYWPRFLIPSLFLLLWVQKIISVKAEHTQIHEREREKGNFNNLVTHRIW